MKTQSPYTIIKDTVRELTAHPQEVFVPLVHPPGEAQVDFGQALVKRGGVLGKVSFFVMALPRSVISSAIFSNFSGMLVRIAEEYVTRSRENPTHGDIEGSGLL